MLPLNDTNRRIRQGRSTENKASLVFLRGERGPRRVHTDGWVIRSARGSFSPERQRRERVIDERILNVFHDVESRESLAGGKTAPRGTKVVSRRRILRSVIFRKSNETPGIPRRGFHSLGRLIAQLKYPPAVAARRRKTIVSLITRRRSPTIIQRGR